MALTASGSGSALVAGSARPLETNMAKQIPQTQKVRVMRAFYFDRKLLEVGQVLDLPTLFAREVEASHKAEILPEAPPTAKPEPSSAAPESSNAPKTAETPGRGKGGKNVK